MSRVGLKPITIESGVTVEVAKGGQYGNITVNVKGPKGELSEDIRKGINVSVDDATINVSRDSNAKQLRAYHGLYRALIQNMISGVTKGYEKVLEIHGVGYRAKVSGKTVEFNLGLNHPVIFDIPEGIEVKIEKDIDITVSGIDKFLVGQVSAEMRDLRKPEPYKGKGIRYRGEYVRRKVGKTAAK